MAGHSKFKNIMHRKGAQDAKRAKKLARIHHSYHEKVLVAAYLHDITKKWTKEEHVTYLDTNEAQLYKDHPYYLHAASAAKYAKEKLLIDDENILNAIYYHSTGRPNMCDIEKLVLVADMCEPKRKKWNPNKLFKLAKKDMNHALIQSLHLKMSQFIESKKEPHNNLKQAYDFYKERIWTK
ncbi:MAG: bis(5'-nucleosyl)-tetraphosphatase (symmetrical) YqeK [Acholeplasmataceae bacterium]